MGNDLLPANPARNAHDFWTDTMGFQPIAQMGRSLGQMADKVSDGTFLWCDALLRGIISLCNSLSISVIILQDTST